MPRRRFVVRDRGSAFAKRVLRQAARDRVTTNAASLAFHLFLAIVPGAIALVGVAGLAGLSHARIESLLHGISVLVPASAAKVFDQALTSPGSRGSDLYAVVFGVLVSLWASIEAAVSLQFALDMAYETRGDRGFLARRVRGLALIGITLLLGGAAFVLLIVGGPLGSLILPVSSGAWAVLWAVGRWVIGVACVVALVSLYDYLGPNREDRRWKLLSVGGSVSTVLWLAVAVGYSLYLNHLGHSSQAYGSFTGVITLLIWLYLSAIAVLVGAEVNRELERSRPERTSAR